ncbi:MAG: cytochrome c oxidase subunit 3 [Flavobacteriaceae bacterium]
MEISAKERNSRTKKMMLWFGMISMAMTFAGLTSAYVVSSSRADWLEGFSLPTVFTYSTLLILLSSGTFYMAKRSLRNNKLAQFKTTLWVTLGLTLAFIYFQFQGFSEIVASGYYFTGAESSITTSFLYVLVLLHLAHVAAGLIVLLVVLTNAYRKQYNPEQTLGVELAELFWHFLDFLWLYLFLFVMIYQ